MATDKKNELREATKKLSKKVKSAENSPKKGKKSDHEFLKSLKQDLIKILERIGEHEQELYNDPVARMQSRARHDGHNY